MHARADAAADGTTLLESTIVWYFFFFSFCGDGAISSQSN
jgi:hypothetical protein